MIATLPAIGRTTVADSAPVHPCGARAKVLLSSVFGPYAQDDEYGSRRINPMELYHNQVTRVQGPFSLRVFHRSWGLMMIQANIASRCTLLDFPDLDRFVEEIRTNSYDIVGISSILVNLLKVKEMCRLVRQYLPEATIVVGGHIANLPDLSERIDADHIVVGEGVGWFRRFLSEDEEQPIRHPILTTPIGMRNVGIDLSSNPRETALTLIPSVGCPMGCNFCSTSAMFGGKGKYNNFYHTGDELFDILCQFEQETGARSFFVMDENFLLHRRRALQLLELMAQNDKSWTFYVFSSANVLRSYSVEQLVSLGVSWVWLGLEGKGSQYVKLHDTDTRILVGQLQSHGIRVLGSTIIGLEEHTPENIDEAIDYAVSHDTDFHQFMLYTPLPGTPLHTELSARGLIRDEDDCPLADVHGQFRFNYRHPYIKNGRETELLLRAFNRDFAVNGPSVVRVARTVLNGWRRYKDHPDARIRRRITWEAQALPTTYAALVAAARRHYCDMPAMHNIMSALLKELHVEFGIKSRLSAAIGGCYVYWKLRQEQRRLDAGWTREPPTFYEKNYVDHEAGPRSRAHDLCRYVTPSIPLGRCE